MPLESTALKAPTDPNDEISPASDFARLFRDAAKPASLWSVGAEVELFGFTRDALERIGPAEVQAVINGFGPETVSRVVEDGYTTEIELAIHDNQQDENASTATASGRLTLEPGGQIEYSGAHRRALADIESSLKQYTARLNEIAEASGIIIVAAGFDPVRGIHEQKWVPKRRYEIMRPYLGTRGRRAWDMMCRTAAIQVNLDYSDGEDLANKFLLANRLGPVAAAIFANSPFDSGKLSGYKSTRYAAWLETDPDRTGPSPVALEHDFSIERFIDYVKFVPMFFIRRRGDYVDMTGRTFDEFLSNGSANRPVFQDFTDHLTTIFTEARLKPHVEQRSMDCGPVEITMAAMAFWKGLAYDRDALEAALAIAPRLSRGEYRALQLEVARHGLEARAGDVSVIELAIASIELARAGLKAVAPGETCYLDVLEQQVVRERISPSDILIRNFLGSWNGDVRKAVEYLRIRESR